MSKPKVSVQEKCQKELPEFTDAVAGLSVEELDARLTQCAKDAEDIRDQKDADEQLEQARAQVSEFAGPYNEGLKINRLKTRYLIALIKEKGGK